MTISNSKYIPGSGQEITGTVILNSLDGKTAVPIDATNPLPVSATFSPSGTQDVNVKQIGGNAVSAGAGATGSGSERVTVAQDATTIAGSAPGTAGTASANVVSVQGVANGTALPISGSTSQFGVNGSSIATVANPFPTFEPDGGSSIAPVSAMGTGTATSAAVLSNFPVDTSGYNAMVIQTTSVGSGSTVVYEGSNDNSTWATISGVNLGSSTGAISGGSSTIGVAIEFPLGMRYFRGRLSVYGSGTFTVVYALRRGYGSFGTTVSNTVAVSNTAVATGGYSNTNIAAATTTTAKSGAGTVHTLNINTGVAAATVTVYDNTAGSGTKIGTYQAALPASYLIDAAFATGLTLVTSGTADVSVTWK